MLPGVSESRTRNLRLCSQLKNSHPLVRYTSPSHMVNEWLLKLQACTCLHGCQTAPAPREMLARIFVQPPRHCSLADLNLLQGRLVLSRSLDHSEALQVWRSFYWEPVLRNPRDEVKIRVPSFRTSSVVTTSPQIHPDELMS